MIVIPSEGDTIEEELKQLRKMLMNYAKQKYAWADIEDLVQEALIASWNALLRWDGRGNRLQWAYIRGRYAMLDRLRHTEGYRRKGRVPTVAGGLLFDLGLLDLSYSDPEILEEPDFLRHVTSDKARRAMFEHYWEDRAYSDIAVAHNWTSLGALYVAMNKARHQIRDALS